MYRLVICTEQYLLKCCCQLSLGEYAEDQIILGEQSPFPFKKLQSVAVVEVPLRVPRWSFTIFSAPRQRYAEYN